MITIPREFTTNFSISLGNCRKNIRQLSGFEKTLLISKVYDPICLKRVTSSIPYMLTSTSLPLLPRGRDVNEAFNLVVKQKMHRLYKSLQKSFFQKKLKKLV